MSGPKKPTTPPRVSFGIELEFFVAFILEGEPDPDVDIKDQLQPLITVPVDWERTAAHGRRSGIPGRIYEPKMEYVYGRIKRALADAGLPVMGDEEKYGEPGSAQAVHGEKVMSSFRVVEDVSLKADHVDGYHWQRVELNSPAMYDMKLSYDMLRVAVSVVTTSFRCRVNPSCGFHVHVGAGPTQRIDARTLRQFAAVLWAADPVISRLHPPWRSATAYSQSARVNEITDLGKGRGPADVMIEKLTAQDGNSAKRGGWYAASSSVKHTAEVDPTELKKAKVLGRDRRLGESLDVDVNPEAMSHEIELDHEDDLALLQTEPWQHQQDVPEARETKPSAGDDSERFGFPPFTYQAPVAMPRNYRNPTSDVFAPPRPRPPPIARRYPRVPGTMRRDIRDDVIFLDEYLTSAGGAVEDPGRKVPPARWDVMSGVRDLLGADLTVAQIGELMRHKWFPKHINYKFDAYSLYSVNAQGPRGDVASERTGDCHTTKMNTVEFREATGSLDMEWIVTWARICCRLLEWSRDAAPAEFLCVIRLLAWAQEEEGAQYDVIDFLIDLGLLTEARFCEERLQKGDAAWWECLNLGRPEGTSGHWSSWPELDDDDNYPWSQGTNSGATWQGVTGNGWAEGENFGVGDRSNEGRYQGIAGGGWAEGEYQFGETWDDDEDEELQPPYDMDKLQEPFELDALETQIPQRGSSNITSDGAAASGGGDGRVAQGFVKEWDTGSELELELELEFESGCSWVSKGSPEKKAVTEEDGFEIVDAEG
ncbi:hypothetical protein ColTof4_04971 [Colletotrichum tofieldiae]|uniref:Amidoligase enzyme n=1 Tax=Colletotrichum tofieldiae TaxID=708197 RepID=A0A166RNQ0_9PEZI|nr:hypothetical protein CT0861_04711 [Colletotrichum tofieldiae]GKT63444.1 hypothetical protein ColTof3_10783 [Colletotrichum tofieldiae]GKT72548.1 hypothetical protein ColTof4_04971 [Colletotrichum tofieldiae]